MRSLEYDMEGFLRSTVALYAELFPTAPSLGADRRRRPSTPCMPENHSGAEAANVGLDIGGGDPSDIDNTVDVSRGNPSGADGAVRGVQYREGNEKPFHIAAAKVLMKMMYAARMARPDILRAISFLAGYLTKWDEDCSKRQRRLMSYVDSTVTFRMYAWNDSPHAKLDLTLKV